MTLDRRELEILTAVLATYTEIAGIVDQKLRDEVVFLRNKLQEAQDKMAYSGHYGMELDYGNDRTLVRTRPIYVATVE